MVQRGPRRGLPAVISAPAPGVQKPRLKPSCRTAGNLFPCYSSRETRQPENWLQAPELILCRQTALCAPWESRRCVQAASSCCVASCELEACAAGVCPFPESQQRWTPKSHRLQALAWGPQWEAELPCNLPPGRARVLVWPGSTAHGQMMHRQLHEASVFFRRFGAHDGAVKAGAAYAWRREDGIWGDQGPENQVSQDWGSCGCGWRLASSDGRGG